MNGINIMSKKIKAKRTPVYGDLRPELEVAIEHSLKNGESGGFLHIYLDNLAMVISSQGGESSEEIVYGLMKDIGAILKNGDSIARRNKDTLRAILRNYSPDDIAKKSLEIHEMILNYGCVSSLEPVQLSAVIGSVDFPLSAKDAEDIINKAYIALMDAQDANKYYRSYQNEAKHATESKNQMIMASYLKQAFMDKRLRLAFQPIIERTTGDIAYYESLLRIINEDGSTSSAGPFIPIAERMGFIDAIDIMVLKMVVAELRRTPDLKLAVNVSNASVAGSKWLEIAVDALSDRSLASRLIVEIIETAEQHNVPKVVQFISTLQKLGCQIALDDFGTGYTSFSQLKSLPVNIIKIDGSFVRDIVTNEKNRFFVKTLLEFSKNFGLKSVAEFVEDSATAEILTAMEVDYLQGNYFSPAVNYRDWIENDI